MSGPETTQTLATHLRRMADNAGDQIDADRLSRAADLVEAPQAVRVKPLVWHKSHLASWNDDWHTVPTGYTIRCADEWGWKWQSPLGAFGHGSTPTAAKAAAQADYEARILAALEPAPDIGALMEAAKRAAELMERHGLSGGLVSDLRAALAALKGGAA